MMARGLAWLGLQAALWVVLPAQAVVIGNTQGGAEFPEGALSFADAVVSYSPGLAGASPSAPHSGAFNALGVPDYTGSNTCGTQEACSFVSLGDGGSIVLRFTDNKLTGSGDSALDLWVFEVGPNVEDTYIDISQDGVTWFAVGKVFGSTAGIDIDAYGFTTSDQFGYIRLTDDPFEGANSGATVGADIDAVGAISTVSTPVPEPGALALSVAGMAGVVALRRWRRA